MKKTQGSYFEIISDQFTDPSKMKSSRTDPQFIKNLTGIYVTSKGNNPTVRQKTLPVDREAPEESAFGYEEPKVIPPGKASLRQILEFVANHSKEPDIYTAEKIAKDYKLDIVDVMNILQYTRTLLIFNPPPRAKEDERNPLRRLRDGLDNLKK